MLYTFSRKRKVVHIKTGGNYNHYFNQYGVALDGSMWYGENKYDINSYGKFIEIPMDNGAKMELELIGSID